MPLKASCNAKIAGRRVGSGRAGGGRASDGKAGITAEDSRAISFGLLVTLFLLARPSAILFLTGKVNTAGKQSCEKPVSNMTC